MYPLQKFKDLPEEQQKYYAPISDIVDSLVRYVNQRIPEGGFMTAVLENNLCQAFNRADLHNREYLFLIVSYVYMYVPSAAWGGPEEVQGWLKGNGGFGNEGTDGL